MPVISSAVLHVKVMKSDPVTGPVVVQRVGRRITYYSVPAALEGV